MILVAGHASQQLGNDTGITRILHRGIEQQTTKDDLAAGSETATFGGDPGVEIGEAGLGLIELLFCPRDGDQGRVQPSMCLTYPNRAAATSASATYRIITHEATRSTVGDKGAL